MRIASPRGIVPRTRGCNLPPEFAETAENLNLASGRFEPWREPVKLIEFNERIVEAHVKDCCWTGTHVCGARYVDAGIDQKTYLSAKGQRPVVTTDLCCPEWCYLGYPVPDTPVAFPDRSACLEKGPDTELRTYRITYSTDCEEGPASCPTDPIVADKDYRIGITFPPSPDPMWCATHINVYRSHSLWDVTTGLYGTQISEIEAGYTSTSTDQDYFLVARLPISTRSWVDELPECEGKLLTTADLLPPREGSQVAGETASGSLVIWHERTVWFSERNKYWGFPLKAAHDFPDNIENVLVCGDSVFVLTCKQVYIQSDAIDCRETTVRLPVEVKGAPGASCCSPVSELQRGVAYSSFQGLAYVGPDGSYRVLSSPSFDKDSWISLGPIRELTITSTVVILSTGQAEYVWVLSLDENGLLPPDLTTLSFKVDDWIEDHKGRLYFLTGNSVYEFNAGPEFMRMDWRQAEQVTEKKTRISAVNADYVKKNSPVLNKVSLYRDGKLSIDKTLPDNGGRIRGSASRCSQLRVRGREPLCSLSYGQGLNLANRGDRQ